MRFLEGVLNLVALNRRLRIENRAVLNRAIGIISVSRRGGAQQRGGGEANASERKQTQTNVDKRKQTQRRKRKQTWTNASKRKQTLTPPFIAVFLHPPFAIPLLLWDFKVGVKVALNIQFARLQFRLAILCRFVTIPFHCDNTHFSASCCGNVWRYLARDSGKRAIRDSVPLRF